jgi:fructokinase
LTKPFFILGVGEVLWDVLPEGARLGGAPANFAVMASRLGNHAAILSRIGRDELAQQAVTRLSATPVDASFLAIDPIHPTGSVQVDFHDGEPRYTISEQAAWDFLELTDAWIRLAERADAFCFGTLAQRSAASRQTIQTLAAETPAACVRVFDVNLRPPFYSSEVVQESLELATVLKMNEDETPLVLNLLGLPAGPVAAPGGLQAGNRLLLAAAQLLLEEFPNLRLVVITRGCRGSLLIKREDAEREEWNEHPGFAVESADPVGAGDAFTAAVVHYLLRGADLATLNEAGNRWGAWMASQPGAMPELPDAARDAITASIERTR